MTGDLARENRWRAYALFSVDLSTRITNKLSYTGTVLSFINYLYSRRQRTFLNPSCEREKKIEVVMLHTLDCTTYRTFLRGRRNPTGRYKGAYEVHGPMEHGFTSSCSGLPARARHRDVAPDAPACAGGALGSDSAPLRPGRPAGSAAVV